MGSTCAAGICNFVTNGDFETGDFTGWTLSDCGPGGTLAAFNSAQHGSYSADTFCGFSSGPATLQQTITGLTVGHTYTMNAYYNGYGFGGSPDGVVFYVNGMQIASRLNQGSADGWFLVTGSFTASATSAVFSFSFGSDNFACGVDNIVIM